MRIPVVIWLGREPVTLLTEDVSFRGLFLRTDSPPNLRQLVRIEVAIPEGPTIRVHAMAVWVVAPELARGRTPGVGLQLYGVGGNDRTAWERFVGRVRNDHLVATAPQSEDESEDPPEVEPIRRRYARTAAIFEVRPRDMDELLNLYTQDISAGGMFLTTPEPIELGVRLAVDVIHPDSSERFPLDAEVRRHSTEPNRHGVGVEFVDFGDAKREAFGAFIYSGVPDYEEYEIIEEGDPELA